MVTDSPTRAITFELAREEFETLKDKAAAFGCSFGDLAKVYTIEGLKRAGASVGSPKPSGTQGRWAKQIETALADGKPATIKDLCAHFGVNHLTIRPVVSFMVAAGTLLAEESSEQRKQGRIPMAYRLAPMQIGTREPPAPIAVAHSNEEAHALMGGAFEWPDGLLTHNDASPSDLEDP